MDSPSSNSPDEDPSRKILGFIFDDNSGSADYDLDYCEYIEKLCSIGVHALEKESFILEEKKRKLIESIQDESYKNYKCFVTTYQFQKDFKKEFEIIENKLDSFNNKVPLFYEKLSVFAEEAKMISKRWRQASLMLAKHNQLLEFLEIPQLMESCVRNNYYKEALQLMLYVQQLQRRYGKDAPMIQSIWDESVKCKEVMISQLVKELYIDIQLSQCLKIINYLRKLDVFSETELRIKFLVARSNFLDSLLQSNPDLSKVIEVSRITLFDIITTYKAIFPLDNGPLNSWLSYRINLFLNLLEDALKKDLSKNYLNTEVYPCGKGLSDVAGNIGPSIVDACFYFGMSMSRVGVDFRPLLVELFKGWIEKRFISRIDFAIERFEKNLEEFKGIDKNLIIDKEKRRLLINKKHDKEEKSSKKNSSMFIAQDDLNLSKLNKCKNEGVSSNQSSTTNDDEMSNIKIQSDYQSEAQDSRLSCQIENASEDQSKKSINIDQPLNYINDVNELTENKRIDLDIPSPDYNSNTIVPLIEKTQSLFEPESEANDDVNVLMHYGPLGLLYNDIVTGLNELNVMIPIGSMVVIKQYVEKALKHCTSLIIKYHKNRHTKNQKDEDLLEVYEILVRCICDYLGKVSIAGEIGKVVGLSGLQMVKWAGTWIDKEGILLELRAMQV